MKILITFLFFTFPLFAQANEADIKAKVEAEVERRLKQTGRAELIDFSKELMRKEEELKLRELQVKKLEEEFAINQKGLEGRVKQFQEMQNTFLACIERVDHEANSRVQHMVDSVSGMRPQNAADVLSVQEAEISVKILGLLDPEKVSRIFNLMDKEVSARLQKQYLSMKK